MKRMTRREQAVYDYVLLFRAKMRFSPSMREIAEGIGLNSVSTVHKHVLSLVNKGWFLPYIGKIVQFSPMRSCLTREQNESQKGLR